MPELVSGATAGRISFSGTVVFLATSGFWHGTRIPAGARRLHAAGPAFRRSAGPFSVRLPYNGAFL